MDFDGGVVVAGADALEVVVHRDAQDFFGPFLPYYIVVKIGVDIAGGHRAEGRGRGGFPGFLGDHLGQEADAVVAYRGVALAGK